MRIGIDFDGSVIDRDSFIQEVGRRMWDYKFGEPNPQSGMEFSEVFGVPFEVGERWWAINGKCYLEDWVRPQLAWFTKAMHERGHEVILVTARGTDRGEAGISISKLLEKNGAKVDMIVYTGGNKAEAVKELGLDVMLEDDPRFLEKLSSVTTAVAIDASYNKCWQGSRVQSLAEYVAAVDELRAAMN